MAGQSSSAFATEQTLFHSQKRSVIIGAPTAADQAVDRRDDPGAKGDDRREPHQAPLSLDQVITR
jgi:hypothetical protein